MVTLANISEMDRNLPNQFLIVRSAKTISPWMVHVPELSPTKELFFRYLDMKKNGRWDRTAFEEFYVPWFLRDIKANVGGSRDVLNNVCLRAGKGEDFTFGCMCTEESMCHRSIIGGLLLGAGCSVLTKEEKDYARYYDMYKLL